MLNTRSEGAWRLGAGSMGIIMRTRPRIRKIDEASKMMEFLRPQGEGRGTGAVCLARWILGSGIRATSNDRDT